MNNRERYLALFVGFLLACGGVYFVYDSIAAALDRRSQQISQLRQQNDEKQRKLKLAKRAVGRLRSYERKSLPNDGDLARSLYQTWLLERIDEAGLHDVKVIVSPTRGRQGVYQRHTFEVTAKGDLWMGWFCGRTAVMHQ